MCGCFFSREDETSLNETDDEKCSFVLLLLEQVFISFNFFILFESSATFLHPGDNQVESASRPTPQTQIFRLKTRKRLELEERYKNDEQSHS